jgi:hypothetical protein
MTSAAYKRLRDNQKQRASFIWSLGDDSNAAWFSESEELDRFVARYLNAVRLSAEDVRIVGRKRLEGSELSLSACEHCSLRPRCHETFGAVSFGEVEVGLFPLATSTAFRVMSKLDGARNVQKTQRSLLSSVLAPLLEEMHAREGNRVPALRLPALVDRPRYWTSFENTYVANWGSEEKRRALVLTAFWTQAEDEESAAKWLVSLAGPFGLPSLGKRIPKSPLPNPTPERAPPPAPPKNAPRPAGSNDKLQRLRNRLDPWLEGGELTMPKDAQDLLFSFIKNALPLAEARVPSRATHDLIKHSGIIRIEGGVTRQATVNFYIDFPRSPETHELIIALAHFEYEGGKSWTFAGAQIHKRSVATWLRRHQHAVMQNFDESRENAAAAVRTAARFLAMAATVVNRAALPRDAAEAIEQIINVAPTAAPHACSSRLKSLYEDLPKRCESVKEFLLAELDVPQGSGGILFIDTHVLIEQLSELQSTTLWEPLPDECFQGASLSRYVALLQYPEKTLWLGLPEAIADERIEIGRRLDKVVTQIALEVSDTSDLKKAFDEFATQAMSLRSSLNKARAGLLDSEFEALAKTLGIEKGKIASHLERAADVVSASDIKSVLSFDSARFEGDIRTINTIAEYVTRVRRFVSEALSVECSLEELSQVREVVVDKLKEFEGMLSHEC